MHPSSGARCCLRRTAPRRTKARAYHAAAAAHHAEPARPDRGAGFKPLSIRLFINAVMASACACVSVPAFTAASS